MGEGYGMRPLLLSLRLPGDNTQMVSVLTITDWPLFLALGVFGAGLSFAFYINGLRTTAPAGASIVAMIEPVTATLFGVVILHESLALVQIIGMALILVTVTALSVKSCATPPIPERERNPD